MYAYKSRIKIPNDRKLVIKLPHDIPEGEAEVIILSDNKPVINNASSDSNDLISRLDEWINQIAPIPHIPLSSLDRGELYK